MDPTTRTPGLAATLFPTARLLLSERELRCSPAVIYIFGNFRSNADVALDPETKYRDRGTTYSEGKTCVVVWYGIRHV